MNIERAVEFSSEFPDGEMFAMSDSSMNDARLQQNLSGELYAALRGQSVRGIRPRFSSRLVLRKNGHTTRRNTQEKR